LSIALLFVVACSALQLRAQPRKQQNRRTEHALTGWQISPIVTLRSGLPRPC